MDFERLEATLDLESPVRKVRLVSPAREKVLASLGIKTIRDLLCHFPFRYIDRSKVETAVSARIGEDCTVIGSIYEITLKNPKPRLSLVEIALVDASGILMVTCFRQPWLMDRLKKGDRLAVAGKVEFNYGFKRMTNPLLEVLDPDGDDSSGLILPVHHSTEKISAAWMRRLVRNALEGARGVFDPLPLALRMRYRLPSRQHALRAVHFPTSMEEARSARRRLAYEEVFLLELHLMLNALKRSEGMRSTAHVVDGSRMSALRAALPFELTGEQARACEELLGALGQDGCANRMLLGDVGTGKTIVAAFGLAAVADTGTQAAMMAPTEVLAQQYGRKLGPLLDEAGITWTLLTGSTSAKERTKALEGLADGSITVAFGTHALLEDDVRFASCSFVVVDEQQRFGVEQREGLVRKGESAARAVDLLYMTATPIPRSMALALYGDLSLSYLHERPLQTAGNTTKVCDREDCGLAYDAARAALARGEQVYVVCPLVGGRKDESERKQEQEDGGLVIAIDDESYCEGNLKAVTREASYLQATVFSEYSVELLHGRMKSEEKKEVMERFYAGETQVLVSTTVIEVGVDVPNATVMIVEDADRFGLAQLHQLRGRVGRGKKPGEVFFVSGTRAPLAVERLAALERTEDGFELATYDLSLRKEGDILGNRQHGASTLKMVNVVRDGAVIEAAYKDARALLDGDPALTAEENRALRREILVVFGEVGVLR